MKIVIVTNILTPYRMSFFDKLNVALKEHGDDLRVYTMCKNKGDRPWEYDEFKRDYTAVLPGIKFRVHSNYVYVNCVKKELEKSKPDFVICAGSYWLPTVINVLRHAKSLKYKTAMWSESHVKEKKSNSKLIILVREIIRKYTLKRFDVFLYASELAKALVHPYAKERAKYIELPNTVDESVFGNAYMYSNEKIRAIRERYRVSEDEFVFFTPARLSPEKGITDFIQLISRASYRNKARFLIAGEGTMREAIKKKAAETNLRIDLLGQKSQEEIVDLLVVSDCFLLPSLSDPNPLSVIEALWAGKLIFISDGVGNQREAVVQGANGFVFSYENSDHAMGMFDQIVSSPLEWRENGKKISRSIAENRYSTNKVVEKLISDIREVIV